MIERFKSRNDAAWHRLRSQDITASVAGALLGEHEFTTVFELWALKTGRLFQDFEETPAIKRGRLLEPVAVQMRHWRIHLVAGRHRLEAARQLGWTQINAIELPFGSVGNDLAEMAEIAENLHRRDIGEIERSELMAKWAEITKKKGDVQSAQLAPIETKREDGCGHRKPGGIRQAARDLEVSASSLRRSASPPYRPRPRLLHSYR